MAGSSRLVQLCYQLHIRGETKTRPGKETRSGCIKAQLKVVTKSHEPRYMRDMPGPVHAVHRIVGFTF